MLVRATQLGYFEGLREIGHEFEVPDGRKSPWWVPVAEAVEAAPAPSEPDTFSGMNSRDAKHAKDLLARRNRK